MKQSSSQKYTFDSHMKKIKKKASPEKVEKTLKLGII